MKIDEKIKKRRSELNLSIEQVAERVGVSKSTIQRWESGFTASIKQSKLVALAGALYVSLEYLIFDDEDNDIYFSKSSSTEIETELVELSRKMTVAQKIELLNKAYEILKRNKKE